jgi:hypothetical protein
MILLFRILAVLFRIYACKSEIGNKLSKLLTFENNYNSIQNLRENKNNAENMYPLIDFDTNMIVK